MVIPTIATDEQLKRLKERLATNGGVVHVSGLWGSSAQLALAFVASATTRAYLCIAAHPEEADDTRDDLELFLGMPCRLFPAWEALPGEGPSSGEIQAERLRLCTKLLAGSLRGYPRASDSLDSETPLVIVAPVQALMQPTPSPEALARNTVRITAGQNVPGPGIDTPDALLGWAVDRGFERLDMVESPGDIARRGDIVDLFAPGENTPYRIQFFDDKVESIRQFDVSTQRSLSNMEAVAISALPREHAFGNEECTSLLDYLPSDTLITLDGPAEIQEMGETIRARLGASDELFSVTDILADACRFPQMHMSRFGPVSTQDEDAFDFRVSSASRFEGSAAEAVKELCSMARSRTLHVVCDNEGERQRLTEMIAEQNAAVLSSIHMSIGVMHRSFEWTATKTVVLSHHELFQRHRPRRRIRRLYASRPLESWTDLKPGDHVVHVVHGIAVYRGLKKMSKSASGQQEEFLSLEFADKAMIHVPCSQVDLVQKYIGSGGRRPQLSKLGGKRWGKSKQQVGEAVVELAESLLHVQAVRNHATGIAYPADTDWQREFDSSFMYEETEDQLLVAGEIREDLTRMRPMDRLVCGDVGYGKTELAMRASFKVVEYGKQVAVLVPTTVLAEQHYRTFSERMAEYPFAIGCLSRFRSTAQQRKLIEQTKKGQVDILIGTHRLLSKDVSFANPGMVIIDEEQRFGVEHKERLKAMRETVDILTLTATPIPRTLHMSLVGIRDISSLQTPPVDRRAISTEVRPFDQRLIHDAIVRELNRDGQVYFVHNYVQSIAAVAESVAQIVPEARVVFAHGQMKDDELEAVMQRFVTRQADVLVSTTIIESGIDIPSVNTIFINRADRFGLADLHQLRGRVGRSDHRAYCYLLLTPDRPPTSKGAKRLKTIEEFSELGSGFRIAMRDLEIRGAGNLLGREQSGHIAAVGYEMYCRLLEQAVHRLKNEPDPTPPPVHVDLEVAAHIPRHYITAERSRIEIYRRIVTCRTVADLQQLEKDLLDAFGAFPKQVQTLLELAEIRVHARRFGISSISLRTPDIVFAVDQMTTAEPVFADAPGTVRMPDAKTVHLRLPATYLEPGTLIPVLRNLLVKAKPRVESAT
ncbi:MAG: transcription-repair coupling factor [Phycisphaerales bacterium]|nr:MAG: transcription-repair coupling factor [Phycisphaerales bacterium]